MNHGKTRHFSNLSLSSDESTLPAAKKLLTHLCQLFFGISAIGTEVFQGCVNKALINVIIYSMHPLMMMDCPWFRKYSNIQTGLINE